MRHTFAVGALLLLAVLVSAAPSRAADDPDTLVRTSNPERYQVVISATKIPKRSEDVPNGVSVVSGDDLRRRGTHTLAEALQDVLGLDTGDGSDNGPNVPNLGLWGLKEFDALLVTLDGVPIGGPFNPSLTQVPVEDIDRIEVVKGPQGTLYGISAFAGMIQIFTRGQEGGRGHLSLGGGSFDAKRAEGAFEQKLPGENGTVRGWGSVLRSDGWQDRTGADEDRGGIRFSKPWGSVNSTLDVNMYRSTQKWGTPLPFDAGEIFPGYLEDRNYAVRGARLDHHVISGNLGLSVPINDRFRFENTLGAYRDRQISVRSFVDFGAAAGNDVPSEGVAIRPIEDAVFEEARLRSTFEAGGRHELLFGGAVTWGKTTADGEGFDFDQDITDESSIPDVGAIPAGDLRSFEDRRTFLGVYARDEWTPMPMFTLSGGGRYDNAEEKLHAQAQEQAPGSPLEVADDKKTSHAWSGDLSGLVRLLQTPTARLDAVNLYANWKSSFKPAAPNLTEAEGAEILDPEWTHSVEAGLKVRGLERQMSLDLSWFDMKFENMVVSILGAGATPELTNAGKERFKGVEAELVVRPNVLAGTSLSLGYAHHDATFVHFTFVTPDGTFRDVSGKKLELVPEDLVSTRLDLRAPMGIGVFGALRYQSKRPYNRRNTFFADSFTEYDAGGSWAQGPWRVSVIGRNLGDDRHAVTESELGDSQFYIASPRRVSAELSVGF